MQAAISKVFKGDTGGVLPRIHPGAPEADLRQQLVTESIKSRLEDSNGILVSKTSTRLPMQIAGSLQTQQVGKCHGKHLL